jgi:hypothetical protein
MVPGGLKLVGSTGQVNPFGICATVETFGGPGHPVRQTESPTINAIFGAKAIRITFLPDQVVLILE